MLPKFLVQPDPRIYLSNNFVVLDWETTNKETGNPRFKENKIVLGSWYCGSEHPDHTGEIRTTRGGELQQQEIVQAIQKADFLVCQNTKFELKWLTRCGLDITKVLCYDTIIGEYVLDGNRTSARDLDSLASKYGVHAKLSLTNKFIKYGVCPSVVPYNLLKKYCEQDVRTTLQVFLKQRIKLDKLGLLPVAFTRNLFTPVLADIELRGMFLDKEHVAQYYKQYQEELAKIEQELNCMVQLNWNSTQQVAEFVYEKLKFRELCDNKGVPVRNKPNKKFPNGAPKVDSDTLEQLQPETEEQRKFIELKRRYSKLNKALSTYLELFKSACEEGDCTLYSNFNQCVTATHRLSSSSPNFQNFDRNFKKLFTSRHRDKGWKIGERDAAQLEFRVAAFLGNDDIAKASILNKEDVHSFTASVIFGKKWDKVAEDKESKVRETLRTEAKAHTFKPLFGGVSGTRDEKRYYEAFKEKYKGVAAEQDAWVNTALVDHKVVTATGLIFYYPDVKMTSSGYIQGNTNVRNYPIQSLATAEIIPMAVVYLWHYIRAMRLQTFIVNTVHDSIITEEDPSETEVLNDITTQVFKKDVIEYLQKVYKINFDVPLDADTKVKTNWSYEW